MMNKHFISNSLWAATWIVATLITVTGCSNSPEKAYPVHGQVTLDGKNLTGGTILFEPLQPSPSGKKYAARGVIDTQGHYELTTFTPKDGAVAGQHRVMVLPFRNTGDGTPPTNYPQLPGKYTSLKTSPLQFEIVNDNNEINIPLTTGR